LNTPSFGGMLSVTPFGLTFSVEALFTEHPTGDNRWLPELVGSFEAFIKKLGPNGTILILEYILNAHLPTSGSDADREIERAIVRGRSFLVADRLTRTLDRAQYAAFYLEPSITNKLRFNFAALFSTDGFGLLGRVGIDYEYSIFSLHAYGGFTY